MNGVRTAGIDGPFRTPPISADTRRLLTPTELAEDKLRLWLASVPLDTERGFWAGVLLMDGGATLAQLVAGLTAPPPAQVTGQTLPRKTARAKAARPTVCTHCGEELPEPAKTGRVRYYHDTCVQARYQARKLAEAAGHPTVGLRLVPSPADTP